MTQAQMAERAATGLISAAATTGTAQSKIWGKGSSNKREVRVWHNADDLTYTASFNCEGMREQNATGNRDDIHSQVTDFLRAAG